MASSFSYMSITKESEGSTYKDEDIELRIRAESTLEWLGARNVLSQTWARDAARCRQEAALKLEVGPSETDYLSVALRLDALLATNNGARGLFGSFKDPELQACEAVLSSYRKNDTHLADSAQTLVQLVKFDIPNENAQVTNANRGLRDLERLKALLEDDMAVYTRQYAKQCAELGIAGGNDLTSEIAALEQQLPEWYDRIVGAARGCTEALEFYRVFVSFVAQLSGEEDSVHCAVLDFVIRNGNDLRIDLERSLRPDSVIEPVELEQLSQQKQEEFTEILWDEPAIEGEIDWDVEVSGIEIVSDNIEPAVCDGGSASWASESILSSRDSRSEFEDNLHELLTFLRTRQQQVELLKGAAQDVILASPDCPDLIRNAHLDSYIAAVSELLQLTQSSLFLHLLQIKVSKRYVSRLAATVRRKLELREQASLQYSDIGAHREVHAAVIASSRPRLAAIEARRKKLVAILESELSAKFKRRVQIK